MTTQAKLKQATYYLNRHHSAKTLTVKQYYWELYIKIIDEVLYE